MSVSICIFFKFILRDFYNNHTRLEIFMTVTVKLLISGMWSQVVLVARNKHF